jgi:hypothetical protein
VKTRVLSMLKMGAGVILVLATLAGCLPSIEELEAVYYTPLAREDWVVSTPEAQGLDPMVVAELYYHAAGLETLYSLLVVVNGNLIAEGYFNEGSVDQQADCSRRRRASRRPWPGSRWSKGAFPA